MIPTKDDIVKDDILKEAQKLFQQFGIRKTTMEDIARAMGKGKSTLYYYFSSKEEIFDAVVIKEMDEVFDRVRQAVEKAESAEDKLRAYTLTKIRAVQKRANLYKIVKGEIQEGLRCMKHIHTEYDAQEVKLVKNILRFGVKNGEFSKAVAKEMDLLPSVIVSSLRGLERDMVIDARYVKLEPRLDSIVSILIKGLSSN
ncbi:TetR/AcrR family transcriptional regulator [Sediminibacterium roseum]|uniref:TetR/AcrR family transcriptional regulator n=1 Tax=Sediminibacterium roseum TaxID=1978412 RepID=A0ABX0A378_9BACT|nr:TetR/AcrR family transcriptional regulator [Sediminibacterium roseum]NCI51878.1 TetR/AcrR family transcriptional regulator [Sediminibacterium roseum]